LDTKFEIMSHRVVFIGAGNLATRLSSALAEKDFKILQVYSRTQLAAKTLAMKFRAKYTVLPADITSRADIYFVALADSAWDDVLPLVDFGDRLVVHCSGSMPLSALAKFAKNRGVFYPLQTFSKNRDVDFREIPVFIEANSEKNIDTLVQIGREISDSVSVLDSEKRLLMHIAAVFSCNFVNFFYSVAFEILKSNEISFDVLKPLIMETARKVQEMHPLQAQTGPAFRFDENIIEKHMKALDAFPESKEMYYFISKSIFEHHQKKR
jgi:predicted short-subunit dehydrogenase-like oxidoreductase (DUF2520 family)